MMLYHSLDEALKDAEVRELRTIVNFTSRVRMIKRFMSDRPIATIGTATLREFILKVRKSGRSKGTLQLYLHAIRAAMRIAQETNSMGQLPRFPRLRADSPRRGYLSPQMIDKIIGGLKLQIDRDFLTWLYITSWRFLELSSLKWDRVYLEEGHVICEETKNLTPRRMPITRAIRAILERRLEAQRITEVTDGKQSLTFSMNPPTPFVFQRYGKMVRRDNLRKRFYKVQEKLGLPHRIIHDLRRSALSNLVEHCGVTERTAMKISGHKSRQVFDRYLISTDNDTREALEKAEQNLMKRKGKFKFIEERG